MQIPTEFLYEQEFTVYRDFSSLARAFDVHLDNTNPSMTIEGETFTASEVFYKLSRETYDLAFSRWSQGFIMTAEGAYLDRNDEQRARAAWTVDGPAYCQRTECHA